MTLDDATWDRFWSKVDASGDCWLFVGARNSARYGHFRWNGKMVTAHRFAYKLLAGPIPRGKEIDHLCRVRHCVNPDHMEVVTPQVNNARGFGSSPKLNAIKKNCKWGHPFDTENTYFESAKKRQCRACNRDRHQAARTAALTVEGDSELPAVRDFVGVDPDFTGELSTDEYVREIRNG